MNGDGSTSGWWRWRAVVVTSLVLVAGVVPMTWPDGRDSFPVSSYPMFSRLRPNATVDLVLAMGDDGTASAPLPTEATGHRHLTQAVRALSEAVAAGGDQPHRMCEHAAAWAGTRGRGVERVQIVTARFDGLAYVRDGARDPVVIAEHASCEVDP